MALPSFCFDSFLTSFDISELFCTDFFHVKKTISLFSSHLPFNNYGWFRMALGIQFSSLFHVSVRTHQSDFILFVWVVCVLTEQQLTSVFCSIHRIQLHGKTRELQLSVWASLVLKYFRHKRQSQFTIGDESDLFSNQQIQRKLSNDGIALILEELELQGMKIWRGIRLFGSGR